MKNLTILFLMQFLCITTAFSTDSTRSVVMRGTFQYQRSGQHDSGSVGHVWIGGGLGLGSISKTSYSTVWSLAIQKDCWLITTGIRYAKEMESLQFDPDNVREKEFGLSLMGGVVLRERHWIASFSTGLLKISGTKRGKLWRVYEDNSECGWDNFLCGETRYEYLAKNYETLSLPVELQLIATGRAIGVGIKGGINLNRIKSFTYFMATLQIELGQ